MISADKPLIHLAYADQYSMVRKSISSFITSYGGYKVDIQADNGEQLITQLKHTETLPDICLLDVDMPVKNGYDTIREIKALWPSMKFLVLTVINEKYTVLQMLRYGANGYLLKSCEPEELDKALISIYQTGYYLSELTSGHICAFLQSNGSHILKINKKELNFLSLCCSDYTYKEIANIMNLSPRTVEGYRDMLFSKLKIRTRTGLAIFALSIGLSPLH